MLRQPPAIVAKEPDAALLTPPDTVEALHITVFEPPPPINDLSPDAVLKPPPDIVE
jgi:hypothetical protein